MALGAWKKTWETAKDEFKDLTGTKKPDVAKLGGLIKKHKTGIMDALKTADSDYAAYTAAITAFGSRKLPEAKVTDALNKFGRSVKDATKQIETYKSALTAEIGKLKDSEEKNLRYRGLKAMAKQLDAIVSELELAQTEKFGAFRLEQKKAEREANNQPAMTPSEMVAVSTDPMLKKSALAGVAKGKAFIAKCKALVQKSPDDLADALKYYNANIQKVARDCTQPLSNTVKRLGKTLPPNVRSAETDLVARNGGSYKLASNTQAREYLAELKLLSGHFKVIDSWANAEL